MEPADDGLGADILKLLGYAFVLGALVAWTLLGRSVDSGFTRKAGLWLAVGVVSTVGASTCAVLVAVKRAEARLATRLSDGARPPA